MITNLTFLEQTDYTKREEEVNRAVQTISSSERTPWGAISGYVSQLRFNASHKGELFRKRTASNIIKSGFVTGCSDVALVFIALARAKGIPTKWVETLEEEWVNDPSSQKVSGHIFTDIFIDGRWNPYEPLKGFIRERGYRLDDRIYLEAGKGLDFSQLYLLENRLYHPTPIGIRTYNEIRSLLDTVKTNL